MNTCTSSEGFDNLRNKFTISEAIDHFGVSKYTWQIFIIMGLTMLCDGFDYMIVSYTMAPMRAEWGLTNIQTGALSSWSIIGIIIGGAISGLLADKYGRKRVLIICMAWYSLLTIPIYFIDTFTTFAVLRVLAGCGIGACLPIGTTMISEIAPTNRRGLFVTAGMAFMVAGWCLAGVVGTFLIPALGWRPMFLIGGLPVFYAVFLHFKMPESLHWLASKGKNESVITQIEKMEKIATGKVSRWNPNGIVIPPPPKKVGVGALFSKGNIRVTIGLWLTYFFGSLVVYGTTIWMPTLLIEKGLSTGSSYALSTAQNFAAIIANLISGFISEKLGRKKHLVLSFILTGAVVAVMAFVEGSIALILFVCILTGFFCNFALTGVQPILAESYRVEYRNTGVAWCQSFARLAAVVSPIIIGYFVGLGYGATSLVFFVIPALLGAVVSATFFKKDTRGVSLEELAQE